MVRPLPGKATTPVPANAATGIALDPTLQWSAGADTVDYDVYFGTDSLSLEQAGRTTPSWAKTGLLASTTYQWRIDSNNATGTTTGDVWTFTTLAAPGQVVSGTPADASTDRPITQDISWSATTGTTTYAVYFGTTTSPPKVVNGQARDHIRPWDPRVLHDVLLARGLYGRRGHHHGCREHLHHGGSSGGPAGAGDLWYSCGLRCGCGQGPGPFLEPDLGHGVL